MAERSVSLSQRGERDPNLISAAVCWRDLGMETDPDGTDPDEDNADSWEIPQASSISAKGSFFPENKQKIRWDASGVPMVYKACAQNNLEALRELLAAGVTKEEVGLVDINGMNGLMIGCYMGFFGVAQMLDKCIGLDINQQDMDGNTALMMAAQSGHVTIVNYLLNYYSGLDIEMRDKRGFTALIKAAMQGRAECVVSLIMAGADVEGVDLNRGRRADEWALLTGRFATSLRIKQLMQRPCVAQITDNYIPEWPGPKGLAEKATAPKSRGKAISDRLRSMLSTKVTSDPEYDGVLAHMVRMTTSLFSPFIAIACRTICPGSPPAVGKCRGAVPEILMRRSLQKENEAQPQDRPPKRSDGNEAPSTRSRSSEGGNGAKQRTHGWLVSSRVAPTDAEGDKASIWPTQSYCRDSAVRSGCIPKIQVSKVSPPTGKREKKRMSKNKYLLPLPKWKYKQLKEDKKLDKALKKQMQEKE